MVYYFTEDCKDTRKPSEVIVKIPTDVTVAQNYPVPVENDDSEEGLCINV